MSSSSGRHIESALAPYAEQLYYARRPDLPPSKTNMPRPNPPPTPGSSSDIRGKEGNHAAPVFNLPPTAYQEQDRASTSSTASSGTGSDSSYRPASPTSREAPRKRQNTNTVITKDDFALPPPPTRSRKIIQMQPSTEQDGAATSSKTATGKTQGAAPTGSKRKQNSNGTTAAGRKIARKTAHSLIERRRRSKMNEEFGVLKDMIPACKGQEMHKLAILQASIEYTRYLEQCVADLQAQNTSTKSQPPPVAFRRTEHNEDHDDDDEEMEDDETAGAGNSTPVTSGLEQSSSAMSLPSLSQITTTSTTSPSIFSAGAGRQYSISSAASQSSYSPYFHSNQASPAFGPQLHHVSGAPPFTTAFGLGSPALKPVDSASALRQIAEGATELSEQQRQARKTGRTEREQDSEATAALLMLNHDRRNSVRHSTGMSVRDLLSG